MGLDREQEGEVEAVGRKEPALRGNAHLCSLRPRPGGALAALGQRSDPATKAITSATAVPASRVRRRRTAAWAERTSDS